MFLLQLFTVFFWSSANAEDFCRQISPHSCTLASTSVVVTSLVEQCQREVATCRQDGYEPQRKCDEVAVCSLPPDLSTFAKACGRKWKGAWGDIADDLVNPKMSPELVRRQEYFKKCFSVSCKKEALGSAAGFFTALELEGNRKELADPKLCDQDPEILLKTLPAEKIAYNCGASAYTLYRQIPKKLKATDNFTEPWPGGKTFPVSEFNKPINLQKTLDAILNKQLRLVHPECFDPITLMELRCYAAFTIIDPLMAVGFAGKALRLVKSLSKTSREVAALEKAEKAGTAKKLANAADTLNCKPGPCPQWMDHLDLPPATVEHIGPHIADANKKTAKAKEALEKIQKELKQKLTEDPQHPPSQKTIERMIQAQNSGEDQLFRFTPNTFFPKDFKVDELVEKIKHGEVPMEPAGGPTSPGVVHYTAVVESDGQKAVYSLYICSQRDCPVTQVKDGVQVQTNLHQGDLMTVFPECGRGVKTLLDTRHLAKKLRTAPDAPLTELITENPCP